MDEDSGFSVDLGSLRQAADTLRVRVTHLGEALGVFVPPSVEQVGHDGLAQACALFVIGVRQVLDELGCDGRELATQMDAIRTAYRDAERHVADQLWCGRGGRVRERLGAEVASHG